MTQATQVQRNTSRTAHQHELGRRVAELLAGSWRDAEVTARTLSEAELTEIVPLLCESGAGALAWWRLRNTPLANTESGHQLHDVYRRHRLAALVHEREIAYVLSLLRAEGIEPVLIKGWAIARLYPDAGLRPYGDIDLCVRPDQFTRARAALKCLDEMDGHYVDLHSSFEEVGRSRRQEVGKQKLARRLWDELFTRSQLVSLKSTVDSQQTKDARPKTQDQDPNTRVESFNVRVLSDEDHLRVLSSHLLRSGARRPPWLCDIALLLEQVQSPKSKVQSLKSGQQNETLNLGPWTLDLRFNWDICAGDGSDRELNWLATTIGLAQQLLHADTGEIENTRLAEEVRNLPRWLLPSVLRQWGRTRTPSPVTTPRLWTLASGLITRLDNPVRATAAVGGQFNNWPRLPYRLGESIMRLPELPQLLLANRGTGKQGTKGKSEEKGAAVHPTLIANY